MAAAGRRVIAGRYELASPIGRGGMGEVWAGYDQRLDRPIAVKLLRADLFPVADGTATGVSRTRAQVIRERFAREARSTARIQHAGVPAVYDAGTDQGELFLVMQLVSGISLTDLMAEEGRFAVPRAAAIAAQIASILAAAHRVALVHRDLKPANVLIAEAGQVTVLDFGIAALLEPGVTRLTASDETLGSPAYMAPEQVLHAQVSPRTDLYALGCVLYEMVTGEQVFHGDTSYALMHAHVDRAAPSPTTLRPDTPDDLAGLVRDLLAKDPADRPADAAAVYERLVGHVPVGAGRSGPATAHDPTQPFRSPLAPPAHRLSRRPAVAAPPVASGGSRVDVAAVQSEAADLLDAGRITQAAEVLTRALASVTSARPGSRDEFDLRLALANTTLFGEDFAGALTLYLEVLEGITDNPDLAIFCRHQIAICRAAVGDTAGALRDFREVHDLQAKRLGQEHPDSVETSRQIVLLMAAAGEVARALDELDRLVTGIHGTDPAHAALGELEQLQAHLRRLLR